METYCIFNPTFMHVTEAKKEYKCFIVICNVRIQLEKQLADVGAKKNSDQICFVEELCMAIQTASVC